MKRILSVLCLLMVLTMCACAEPPYTPSEFNTLSIVVSDKQDFRIQVPSDLTLVKTDNYNMWEFEEGVNIYVLTSKGAMSAKDTRYPNVFYSNNTLIADMDECSIVVEAPSRMLMYFLDALGTGELVDWNKDFDHKVEEIKYLPEYQTQFMKLDEKNFYMPADSTVNGHSLFQSSICTNGTDWLESWIKDVDYESLCDLAYNLVNNNESSDVIYYDSGDRLYIECGNNVFGAVRLSYNQWYCYYGSVYYKDCILQGINTVHRK